MTNHPRLLFGFLVASVSMIMACDDSRGGDSQTDASADVKPNDSVDVSVADSSSDTALGDAALKDAATDVRVDGGAVTTVVEYSYGNQIFGSTLAIDSLGRVIHTERACCPPTPTPKPEADLTSQQLVELLRNIEAVALAPIVIVSGGQSAFGSSSGFLRVRGADLKEHVVRAIEPSESRMGLDRVTKTEAPEGDVILQMVDSFVEHKMYR